MDNILVAIHCLAYNHEPYIRECLDGFIMQKTNFKFVAIVHEDASTDRTATIIKEYAEKYPDIIKPIFESENQYSKRDGTIQRIMSDAIEATGAKYVAMCEGDDYWIDPYKLQKQVDFLENNSSYDMVCTRFNHLIEETSELKNKDLYDNIISTGIDGMEITQKHFINFAQPHTCTVLYKNGTLKDNDIISKLKYRFDIPLFYCFLYKHRIWLMNEKMAVYRCHANSLTRRGLSEAWNMYEAYADILRYVPNDPYLPILCSIRYRADYIIPKSMNKKYEFKEFIIDIKTYLKYKPKCRNVFSLFLRIIENRIKTIVQ